MSLLLPILGGLAIIGLAFACGYLVCHLHHQEELEAAREMTRKLLKDLDTQRAGRPAQARAEFLPLATGDHLGELLEDVPPDPAGSDPRK